MKKISVNIITNRTGGLDAQIQYFDNQTLPHEDFEIIIRDELWDVRHEMVERVIKKSMLDIVYIKPKQIMSDMVNSIATARNECLIYSDAEYILFFDDYQIPTPNLLEQHIKHLNHKTAVVGQQINLNYMDIAKPDYNNIKVKDHRYTNNKIKEITYGWFWTNNASVSFNAMLNMNGVDERFNGTYGSDYGAIGLSLTRMHIRFIYNPNALCYHIDHDEVLQSRPTFKRLREKASTCYVYEYKGHSHKLAAFINNVYNDGDSDLMEDDQFICHRDKWGIKRYHCKICGVEGVCDSYEPYNIKLKEDTYVAPLELFDLNAERIKFANEKGSDKYIK